jgi:hypothetical protein
MQQASIDRRTNNNKMMMDLTREIQDETLRRAKSAEEISKLRDGNKQALKLYNDRQRAITAREYDLGAMQAALETLRGLGDAAAESFTRLEGATGSTGDDVKQHEEELNDTTLLIAQMGDGEC